MNFPLSYTEIDPVALSQVLQSYAGRHHEEIVRDFEIKLKAVCGSPNALATQSGTAALHLALRVAGVKAGDYVVAPTFAYVATVSPVTYLGANLILVDSERDTWNMDPALVGEVLNEFHKQGKPVRAIVVVHNYGIPAQLRELTALAKKYDIPLIEDAAESFGSVYHGRWTGTWGDLGVYSFNSNKTITGYGGGALVSSRADWIEQARYLATHARSPVEHYEHETVGYNYRMSPLTAASVLTQLGRLDELHANRKSICLRYREKGEAMGLKFQLLDESNGLQPWLPACLLPGGSDISGALKRLISNGMEGRRLWKPMHLQPAFAGSIAFGGSISTSLFDRGICLPTGSFSGFPVSPEGVLRELLRS